MEDIALDGGPDLAIESENTFTSGKRPRGTEGKR
jgi:hypothetical protein